MVAFLAYYPPAAYENLLEPAEDRKNLDDTWEEWLFPNLKTKAALSGKFEIEEIHLNVIKMHAYFETKKIKNIGKSKATYVTELGMKIHKQRNSN